MRATGHTTSRTVADASGNLVACTVDMTVYTYDGEDVTTIVTQAETQLDSSIRATGRAFVDLPATAARPTPGKPFPKVAPGKP